MPGTFSVLCIYTDSLTSHKLWGGNYYLNFMDKETEVQRVTWLNQSTQLKCFRERIWTQILCSKGFPRSNSGREPACQRRRLKRQRFNPWVGKIPWRRAWQPTPVVLPWTRSLVGYSGLQSMGSQRVRHDGSNLAAAPRECGGWFDLLSRPLKLTPYQQ